jgi:hypothetical protein
MDIRIRNKGPGSYGDEKEKQASEVLELLILELSAHYKTTNIFSFSFGIKTTTVSKLDEYL